MPPYICPNCEEKIDLSEYSKCPECGEDCYDDCDAQYEKTNEGN